MAPPTRTETESVRREQILTAAREVFRRKGYEQTTVADIVKEAGVAQGTFYLYFSHKQDAVLAMAERVMETVGERLNAVFSPELTFVESMGLMIKTAFQVGRENPDLCNLLHVGAGSVMEETRKLDEHQAIVQGMTALFKRAIENGEMESTNPEVAAQMLPLMIKTALHEAFTPGNEGDVVEIEAVMTQFIVNGLRRR